MNCSTHYDRKAVTRCGECGRYICHECAVPINKVFYCKDCVSSMADIGKTTSTHYQGDYIAFEHKSASRRNKVNGFFLFCLSAVPGLNYMYLGLLKRGMFFMSMFFLIIFLAASFELPLLIFVMLIEMSYSFFDGFRLRRNIIDGIPVTDSVDDIADAFNKNKRIIMTVTISLLALSFVQKLSDMFSRGMRIFFGRHYSLAGDMMSFLFGMGITIIGCYIVFKAIGKKSAGGDEHNR